MSSKKTTFAEDVLSELNKTDDQVQVEKVTDIVEDYILETESQISIYEREIPFAEKTVTRFKRQLEKDKTALEQTYLNLQDGNYSLFLQSIIAAEEKVSETELDIANAESDIATINANIDKYKKLLKRLKK
ncbi:MAG: hypothetical protein GY827_04800 [Cytophagales bacterium]|nr:hypothetical protein [Cytophagales bacterium]